MKLEGWGGNFAAVALVGVTLAGCDQVSSIVGWPKGPFALFNEAACEVERPEHVADLHKVYDGMVWGLAHEAFKKNYAQYAPTITTEQAKACFAKVDKIEK